MTSSNTEGKVLYREGQRVEGTGAAGRMGTVRIAYPSSPHVVLVEWDDRPGTWVQCGTGHLRVADLGPQR